MPFAAEFHQAAVAFDGEAIEADGLQTPMSGAFGPDVLTGGALTADVSTLISTAGLDNGTDAGSLRSLADECRRRAEIVEAAALADQLWGQASYHHALQMSDWNADHQRWQQNSGDHSHPGVAPSAPRRPVPQHDWIEF